MEANKEARLYPSTQTNIKDRYNGKGTRVTQQKYTRILEFLEERTQVILSNIAK